MGRRLGGRYRLDEPVGSGGMAVVWRAWDLILGRTVAVKVLLPHRSADRRIREQVKAEARAAAQLAHPNVATVHDFGEFWGGSGRLPYVVMEFVDGETLAERLRTEGPLDWRTAAVIAADVAEGLAAAHRYGLVHRDVKPGNVLLATSGAVKVVDFGIAAAAGDAQADTDGRVFATPAYAAPEQFRGYPVAATADMYAFGLLLYECLTGRTPPPGPGQEAALAGIPVRVAELCRQCLSPDPSDRPASADAARLLARAAHPDGPAQPVDPRRSAPVNVADAGAPTRPDAVATTGGGRTVTRRPQPRRLTRRRVAVLGGVPTGLAAVVLAAHLSPLSLSNAADGTPDADTGRPPEGCAARYTAWEHPDSTFTADLTVTHTGAQRLDGWVVSFTLPSGHRLSEVEGAGWRQDGRRVRLTGTTALSTGQVATVSLTGTVPQRAGPPAGIAVDGIPCDRAVSRINAAPPALPSAPVDGRVGDAGGKTGTGGATGARSGARTTTRPPELGTTPPPVTPDPSDHTPTSTTEPTPTTDTSLDPTATAGPNPEPTAEPTRSAEPTTDPTRISPSGEATPSVDPSDLPPAPRWTSI